MTGREPYSSKHRTALVLTGTGTAGAYHAGRPQRAGRGRRQDRPGRGARHRRHRRIVHRHRRGRPPSGARRDSGGRRPSPASTAGAPRCAPSAGRVPRRWLSCSSRWPVSPVGLVVYPASLLLGLAGLDAGRTLADELCGVRARRLLAGRSAVVGAAGVAACGRHRARGPRGRGLPRPDCRADAGARDSSGGGCSGRRSTAGPSSPTGRPRCGVSSPAARSAPRPDPADLSRRYAELLDREPGPARVPRIARRWCTTSTRGATSCMAALTEPHRRAFFGRRAARSAAVAGAGRRDARPGRRGTGPRDRRPGGARCACRWSPSPGP